MCIVQPRRIAWSKSRCVPCNRKIVTVYGGCGCLKEGRDRRHFLGFYLFKKNILHLCLLMICSTDSSSSFSLISPRARFSLSSGESVHADLNSTGCSNKHTKLNITGCSNKHAYLDNTECFNKLTNLTGSSNKHALL